MSLPTNELLEEVGKLPPVQKMRFTVNHAVKSGAIVGTTTIVSGILGGPIGVAIGGIISSCATSYYYGSYQSIPEILMKETTQEQKEKLAESLRACLNSRNVATIRDLILMGSNEQLIQTVIQIVVMFLASEFGSKYKLVAN